MTSGRRVLVGQCRYLCRLSLRFLASQQRGAKFSVHVRNHQHVLRKAHAKPGAHGFAIYHILRIAEQSATQYDRQLRDTMAVIAALAALHHMTK